ncbi:lipase member M-like, partial [Asbolus verrucosus]
MNIYFSSDCYYIPDNYDDVLEIISRHTGVGETHNVTTEDGYILSLFRIPQNNPKDVILFQHGIIQDSQQWVTQYNESVAFLFWKAGYDVWLGNSRGNFYSKKHITLTPKDEKFWDYSFNEIGYYDNNATIEYIKSTTNAPKIIYLGFSMGATSGLVYASMRPEDATNSVKVMISLAPVSFMKYLKTPLKTMFSFSHFLMTYELHKVLRWYSLFNHNSWHLCILRCFNRFFPFKQLFIYVIEYIAGWTSTEID